MNMYWGVNNENKSDGSGTTVSVGGIKALKEDGREDNMVRASLMMKRQPVL